MDIVKWKEFGEKKQYRVSFNGLVQTRTNGNSKNLKNEWRNKTISFKKSDYTGAGYLVTGIKENGKFKSEYVHRIVAKIFIDNHENKPQVNHIDGNRLNNNYINLEWTTALENSKNSVARGAQLGKGAFKGKLKEHQVLEIIKMINSGKTNRDIADIYQVDRSNISKIRNKKGGLYSCLHSLVINPLNFSKK